jgi:hypothetical protein
MQIDGNLRGMELGSQGVSRDTIPVSMRKAVFISPFHDGRYRAGVCFSDQAGVRASIFAAELKENLLESCATGSVLLPVREQERADRSMSR